MSPVSKITENAEEAPRSNRRPIELIDSPAFQRSRNSALWATGEQKRSCCFFAHAPPLKKKYCAAFSGYPRSRSSRFAAKSWRISRRSAADDGRPPFLARNRADRQSEPPVPPLGNSAVLPPARSQSSLWPGPCG